MAIWEPYDSNRELLALFDIAPDRLKKLSLGFHEKLIDIDHRSWEKKDIDVLFFGSVSPRRQTILQALSQRFRVTGLLDAPAAFRNDLIARARVNLNIHNSDQFRHLSLTRTTYLLNNRCILLSETSDTHPELRSLVLEAPYEQLATECEKILSRNDIQHIVDSSFEQFQTMPMTNCLRELIP